MKPLRVVFAAVLVLAVALFSGCSDKAPDGPVAGLGGSIVTKYVALGNSMSAGYRDNALYASAQTYSFPKLIAQQLQIAGATVGAFEQPLYGDPGNADPLTGKAARYEIISLVGPVIGPRGLTAGSPANTALARQYDNLAVPGAVLFDLLDTASFTAKAGPPRNNPFFSLVLRNPALGRTILAQARALRPELLTFWLGSNDVLGYATSGGTLPPSPTNGATFAFLYTQALDSLRAAFPNAKIVVANIMDIKSQPFFTTLGPKISATLRQSNLYLRYQKAGNTSLSFDSTMLTEANAPMILLTGSAYAAVLGQPTGKWYRDKAYPAIPAGIDTTKPFGFHPQNPWPDALVLDAQEQTVASTAVSDFNNAIASAASAHSAALMDVNALFNRIRTQGYSIAGTKLTTDFITGGLFGLDGVHPSARGAGVVANEFIKVMNQRFSMSIPLVDIASIPGIPAPVSKLANNQIPQIPLEAFSSLEMLWGTGY